MSNMERPSPNHQSSRTDGWLARICEELEPFNAVDFLDSLESDDEKVEAGLAIITLLATDCLVFDGQGLISPTVDGINQARAYVDRVYG